MEEKALKMAIYLVLGVCNDDEKTYESCVKYLNTAISLVETEETKADKFFYILPEGHPARLMYEEIRNEENLLELLESARDTFENAIANPDAIREIREEEDVDILAKELLKWN